MEKTNRGFNIFGRVPTRSGEIRVQESSIAFAGAHVWLFHEVPDNCDPEIDVASAKQLITLLQEFVRSAEADELTEPATCPTDDAPGDGLDRRAFAGRPEHGRGFSGKDLEPTDG